MNILICSAIFSESEEVVEPGVSPAGNQWICNLISGLKELGSNVNCLGHVPAPVWPRGPFVKSGGLKVVNGVNVRRICYLNLPLQIRRLSLVYAYKKKLRALLSSQRYDMIISYNISSVSQVLAGLPKHRRPQWISILADSDNLVPFWSTYLKMVGNADGHVFLSWQAYCDAPLLKKLHMEGGVVVRNIQRERESGVFNIVYAGNFSDYAGATKLVSAFRLVTNENARLLLCGKGDQESIKKLAAADSRVRMLGTLSRGDLIKVFYKANMFANPRPSGYSGNDYNFPSKILEYLSYGRPILSTWSAGLPPAYAGILAVVNGDSVQELAAGIQRVIGYTPDEYAQCATKIESFVSERHWGTCADKLLRWAQN